MPNFVAEFISFDAAGQAVVAERIALGAQLASEAQEEMFGLGPPPEGCTVRTVEVSEEDWAAAPRRPEPPGLFRNLPDRVWRLGGWVFVAGGALSVLMRAYVMGGIGLVIGLVWLTGGHRVIADLLRKKRRARRAPI